MKTANLVISTLIIAAASSLPGCGTGEAGVTDEATIRAATPVPVKTALPYRTDIYASYEATAPITSDADAPAVARVSGELVELLVEEGDTVRAGQVLARLDGKRLRLEMLAAKADLLRASKEYTRNIDLHQRGLVSASMFEGLKFDVAALEAKYKLTQLEYDYSNIRAPIAGVVSGREIKPGQTVNAGDVAFRITDTTELLAELQIPQAQLPKFETGHAATLQVASMPDVEFQGTVVRISPTIDARNGTFRATVRIMNDKGDLAPGMFGRFTIAYESHPHALVIPSVALLDDEEQTTVYVVSNDQVVRRIVETGIEAGDTIEIIGGLSEEEQVVIVGQGGLHDGSRVLASNTLPDSFSG